MARPSGTNLHLAAIHETAASRESRRAMLGTLVGGGGGVIGGTEGPIGDNIRCAY